jgi:hypothetical protein
MRVKIFTNVACVLYVTAIIHQLRLLETSKRILGGKKTISKRTIFEVEKTKNSIHVKQINMGSQ